MREKIEMSAEMAEDAGLIPEIIPYKSLGKCLGFERDRELNNEEIKQKEHELWDKYGFNEKKRTVKVWRSGDITNCDIKEE